MIKDAIVINEVISVPLSDVEFVYTRAAGPGGQHVNMTDSAVQLRYDLGSSGLPAPVVARLRELSGRKVSKDGFLVIKSYRYRSQLSNFEDAVLKFRELVLAALVEPQVRHATRVPRSSKRERRDEKSRRSTCKRLRARPSADE